MSEDLIVFIGVLVFMLLVCAMMMWSISHQRYEVKIDLPPHVAVYERAYEAVKCD